MTGAPPGGIGLGVQMFSFRHSSNPVGNPVVAFTCAQFEGPVFAWSTVGAHGSGGAGRFHRRPPVGGAANGTPRKAHEAPLSRPWISPLAVITRHDGPSVRTARDEAAPATTTETTTAVLSGFMWPPVARLAVN
jgi:hypothetical protein